MRLRLFALICSGALAASLGGACSTDVALPFGSGSPSGTSTPTGTIPTSTVSPTPGPTVSVPPGSTLVPNQCFALTSSLGIATFRLADAASGTSRPDVGELLIVHQVTDDTGLNAIGDQTPITSQTMAGDAGRYVISRVVTSTVQGADVIVTVDHDTHSFTSSGPARRAQACTFPHFDQLSIASGGQLNSAAWDGEKGGVLAFRARHLVLEGLLDMKGRGGRGGSAVSGNSNCPGPEESSSNADAGGKGDSIDGTAHDRYGIGNLSNGAGGGAQVGAGGGGGALYGAGGNGGGQTPQCVSSATTAGRGGASITIPFTANAGLFLGGGGGAGQNTVSGQGGSGGGIIFVVTSSISGAGSGSLLGVGVFGGNAGSSTGRGAGGGGAGGMVILSSKYSDFSGLISVDGGSGGSQSVANGGNGGGGGGGIIVQAGTTTSAALLDGGGSVGGGSGTASGGGTGATFTLTLPLDVPLP